MILGSQEMVSVRDTMAFDDETMISARDTMASGDEAMISARDTMESGDEAMISARDTIASGDEAMTSEHEAIGSPAVGNGVRRSEIKEFHFKIFSSYEISMILQSQIAMIINFMRIEDQRS